MLAPRFLIPLGCDGALVRPMAKQNVAKKKTILHECVHGDVESMRSETISVCVQSI